MNVVEAVKKFAQMPVGSVLVARPPLTCSAEAMFVKLTDSYEIPTSVLESGFEYLLGQDDLEEQLAFLKTKKVSDETVAEFIIYYGLYDSPPAWINDVPDK